MPGTSRVENRRPHTRMESGSTLRRPEVVVGDAGQRQKGRTCQAILVRVAFFHRLDETASQPLIIFLTRLTGTSVEEVG